MDEAIRWALCCHLQSKERNEWFRVFLIGWVRYFGPPLTVTSYQEGAVISDRIGRACEAYNIERDLTGSEGHTATGVCERPLGLVKLAALKMYAQVQTQGLTLTHDDCVYEACMATHSNLVYGSSTPNQALLGFEPRDLYSMDSASLCSYKDANSSVPDRIESHIRGRLLAKSAITEGIVEHQLSAAANTKVQQYSGEMVEKLQNGSRIDIWREPEQKDQTGWRGPAEMIKLNATENKAIVEWRGNPMLIPLRHCRPHVGFVAYRIVLWTGGLVPPVPTPNRIAQAFTRRRNRLMFQP